MRERWGERIANFEMLLLMADVLVISQMIIQSHFFIWNVQPSQKKSTDCPSTKIPTFRVSLITLDEVDDDDI